MKGEPENKPQDDHNPIFQTSDDDTNGYDCLILGAWTFDKHGNKHIGNVTRTHDGYDITFPSIDNLPPSA